MEKIKFLKIILIIFFSCFVLSGCINLLENYTETITEHRAPEYIRPSVEVVAVSDYDDFFTNVLSLINNYETTGQLLYYTQDGENIQDVIDRAENEIKEVQPLAIFAVADITINATRMVTHYEIDIEIEYKKTLEQIESIVHVSTMHFMRSQLLFIMSQYKEEAVIRSTLYLNEEIINEMVKSIYYQNPGRVVMLPVVTVQIFPDEGIDRIYEIQFGYSENSNILQRFGELLILYIERNADRAVGNTNSEITLSLAGNLIETTAYDEAAAGTIFAHGAQNLAATAYGAFIRSNAVGEGFAMAFKALADELNIDCRVILGELNGRVHAWNIINLYGDYYHIDLAMCVVNGIETAFLKTDADFEEMLYTWDRENTVLCEGELTLDDISNPEDINGNGNDDDPDNDPNGGEN